MSKEIKLKFEVDKETFKAIIAACVVYYHKFLRNYAHAVTEDGAAALCAYEWATANVNKSGTIDQNVSFKLTLSEGFALISALEAFGNNHPLSLVIAQEIRNKLHMVMVANQNAYRIQNQQELLPS